MTAESIVSISAMKWTVLKLNAIDINLNALMDHVYQYLGNGYLYILFLFVLKLFLKFLFFLISDSDNDCGKKISFIANLSINK